MFMNSNQWYKHQVTNWMNTWKHATIPGFQITTLQFILRDWHSLPNHAHKPHFILKKSQWDMQYYWKWTLKELLVRIFHMFSYVRFFSFIDSVHLKKKKLIRNHRKFSMYWKLWSAFQEAIYHNNFSKRFANGKDRSKWMWSNPARMGADLPRSISFIPVPGLVFCKPHCSLTLCHSGPTPLLCPSSLSLFWSLPFSLCGAFLAAVLCTTIIREIPMFPFRLAILMCCTLYWSRIVQARLLTC